MSSTYRLQFHPGFRFADAHALVPYLTQLGVTSVYSSPLLKAGPGSTHGYDICDHSELNPDLGSRAEFDAFTAALDAHAMGHILDVVPNHMAAHPTANLWWRDVLENGPSSPYAEFFDVDWDPVKPELKGKVLLPLLGDQYGQVLERGELTLGFARGELTLHYFDANLPINPRQTPRILGLKLDRLQTEHDNDPAMREYLSILTALHNLPAYTERDPARVIERHREKEVTRERLARLAAESPFILAHIQETIRVASGTAGDRSSFDHLHELLERQAYRLAYWRTAFHEINYRRFFDINQLVALRVEDARVFDATHALVGKLIESGQVTGLRVDHPDGLFDPQKYFERLQQFAVPGKPLYVVAEKILSKGETLQAGWPVSGTTGYTFLNEVSGLFVEPRAAKSLWRLFARFTGLREPFDQVAYEGKRTIMRTSMASELNVLAHALNRISEGDRRWRDFTLESCRKVLLEVVACFRVYRTYINERGISEFDRAALTGAIEEAERRNPLIETSIFNFLGYVLLSGDHPAFAMKFQQFTGPVQAKGVEDTAFYRYNVLISANDVGGHPQRLGFSPDQFHEACRERLHAYPTEMTATATHDAKRGEDARARINAISEDPSEWRRRVAEWMRINASNRTRIEGAWAPDRSDEYLFYQALLGAWPAEADDLGVPTKAPEELERRLNVYMQKAVREAKVHTSWVDEDLAYGEAVARFVERSLRGRTSRRFLGSFVDFQRWASRRGLLNALSQLVLKIAAPGVPDFYQGSELWNFDLVDPDNRRPVDYEHRRRVLDELMPLIDRVEGGEPDEASVADLLTHWHDGRIKLFTTAIGLRFRRTHASLVQSGAYLPLAAEGEGADHLVGLARHDGIDTLLAIVPRFSSRLEGWGATRIAMPAELQGGQYRHLLTGQTIHATGDPDARRIEAAHLFSACPVALLAASLPATPVQ